MESIKTFNIEELPSSSFIIVNSRRRSGKSILVEDIILNLKERKLIDTALLFSKTDAGFKSIPYPNRFTKIDMLPNIINNMRLFNEYNKVTNKEKNKFKLKMAVIIDDFAIDLKGDKAFHFLTELALNGRHSSYPPMSIHIFLISQSLTKIPKAVRLQADIIMFSQIASRKEQDQILDENFYILDGSFQGRKYGRQLYNDLVKQDDYIFVVIESFREGKIQQYGDYIKTYKADINKIKQ